MATSQGAHVIVGGLGSLGRALQQHLLAHGKQVRVLDLAPSAHEAASRLVHPTAIEYVPCDLSTTYESTTTLRSALNDAETVYSVVTPDVIRSSAADMRRANVDGVQHLIETCRTVGVPKLVYGSSMAVTNQLLSHHEENEETPLPAMDTYRIAYDRTKRQGEELVLQAHQPDQLHTCSLRLGTILGGSGDYITRNMLASPGRVVRPGASHSQPMDFISAQDLATAFGLASDKLDAADHAVGGTALFVTKCKTNKPSSVGQVLTKYANELDWRLIEIPSVVLHMMAGGYRTLQAVKGLLASPTEETTPGYPFDCSVEATSREFTFDNSKARQLLEFEPQETWEDAVVRISKEIRLVHPELFKK